LSMRRIAANKTAIVAGVLVATSVGLAFEGGIGIVVLAIVLDRVMSGIEGGGRARKAS
jgi:ABC-type proline/glycine betaine transport system permease subunit